MISTNKAIRNHFPPWESVLFFLLARFICENPKVTSMSMSSLRHCCSLWVTEKYFVVFFFFGLFFFFFQCSKFYSDISFFNSDNSFSLHNVYKQFLKIYSFLSHAKENEVLEKYLMTKSNDKNLLQ